ncbi:MAG: hypothetical protein KF841_13865 [Phycisphaerae bacterium]|nr:hypothetical protein [Phycisphaerae bacterium]
MVASNTFHKLLAVDSSAREDIANATSATAQVESVAMPAAIYVKCPKCEHPAVLRRVCPGQAIRCRQCNSKFTIRMPRRAVEIGAIASSLRHDAAPHN